ncbi:MAG: ExbD/TolR family protein [Planctomycetota bacterium]|jgi:biopolymer transport protein ExbD
MPLREANDFRSSTKSGSFNITPLIDIVFLLIIFFLVVCQFIEAENFPVTVPDDCDFAQSCSKPGTAVTTVTVLKTNGGRSTFAVGAEKIPASDGSDLTEQIARLVDLGLRNLPYDQRIVTLRVDRDVCFAEAQYALAAIAQSTATDIQLAVLKNKEPPNREQ